MNKKNKSVICILGIVLVGLIVFINMNYKSDNLKYNSEEYPEYVKNTEINEEFFESLGEKQTILFKILNSIDFYNTAKGSFITKNMKTNEETGYKFEVNILNKMLKVESKENLIIIQNNVKYEINKENMQYRKFEIEDISLDENIGKLKPKDRIIGKKDKEFISRPESQYLLIVNKILLNEELGISLLNNDNWELNNSKKYLNRDTVEIKRRLGFTGKSGENNINVLVDKENGTILKEEVFDRDNKIIFYTKVKEIEFNKKINDDFIKEYENLNKYKLVE